jgi:large subunit ribosomal protein L24
MAYTQKKEIRFSPQPISKKVKMGGQTVVSKALVKSGSTNLTPKIHVKRGDMVMLISGSKQAGRGEIGKVLNVFPKTGKVVVEGLNMITRATRQRSVTGQSGLIKREGPVFASRVMLYCTSCKKPTRVRHKIAEGKKARVCTHCQESFDS